MFYVVLLQPSLCLHFSQLIKPLSTLYMQINILIKIFYCMFSKFFNRTFRSLPFGILSFGILIFGISSFGILSFGILNGSRFFPSLKIGNVTNIALKFNCFCFKFALYLLCTQRVHSAEIICVIEFLTPSPYVKSKN